MAAPYRPFEAIQLLRPSLRTARISPGSHIIRVAFSVSRPALATHTSNSTSTSSNKSSPVPGPPRRSVTVTNDTGAVRWSDLSLGEKAARTTQQSVNLAVILAGLALTGAISYYLFTDVFSPDSKTSHFNRAVTKVREHPEAQKLLGVSPSTDSSKSSIPGLGHQQISAFGEASWSRWARNRHIASSTETDKWGTEHLRFKFYVEGPTGATGVVHVHLTKRPSQKDYEYALLALDVKGQQRLYLENADARKDSKLAPKIFGARWW